MPVAVEMQFTLCYAIWTDLCKGYKCLCVILLNDEWICNDTDLHVCLFVNILSFIYECEYWIEVLIKMSEKWRVKPGFHYPSWRPELTDDRFQLPVNTGRVDR